MTFSMTACSLFSSRDEQRLEAMDEKTCLMVYPDTSDPAYQKCLEQLARLHKTEQNM